MSKYSELLKDPRWQKKRLEILERDNWTCLDCGSATKTLHVHHCLYIHGKMPWEYQDCELRTECWECHEERQNVEQVAVLEFKRFMAGKQTDQIVGYVDCFLSGLGVISIPPPEWEESP